MHTRTHARGTQPAHKHRAWRRVADTQDTERVQIDTRWRRVPARRHTFIATLNGHSGLGAQRAARRTASGLRGPRPPVARPAEYRPRPEHASARRCSPPTPTAPFLGGGGSEACRQAGRCLRSPSHTAFASRRLPAQAPQERHSSGSGVIRGTGRFSLLLLSANVLSASDFWSTVNLIASAAARVRR